LRRQSHVLAAHLHREHLEIWSKDNFPLIPVLVFDQFEEMFSHQSGDPKRIEMVRHRDSASKGPLTAVKRTSPG
jgi:hypothetical protein